MAEEQSKETAPLCITPAPHPNGSKYGSVDGDGSKYGRVDGDGSKYGSVDGDVSDDQGGGQSQGVKCWSQMKNVCHTIRCFQPNYSPHTENIIALFWALFVFFIGVVFVIAQYTTALDAYNFASTYWVLFIFILIAIIGMAIVIHHRNNDNVFEIDNHKDDHHDETVSKYLIANVYVFAAGNFFLDMFSIVTVFHCGLGTINSKQKHQYAVKFIFHFARIIFTALQLIFLQVFITAKIKETYRLWYKVLLVHIVATNFDIWFTFLCQETGILAGSEHDGTSEYELLNCTSNANDSVFKTAKKTNEDLEPFILEFSLLAASLLCSIYPLKNVVDSHKKENPRKSYGRWSPDDSKSYKSDPGLLLAIFVALLLILSSWSLDDNEHYIYDLRFNYWMQIIVQLLMTLSCFMVLKEMRRYHEKERDWKYKIDDYLVLTGPLGFLPFLIVVFFSVTEHEKYLNRDVEQHETEVRGTLGLLALVNIFSVLVQTFFLLAAHAYKRTPVSDKQFESLPNEKLENNYKKLRSAARIGQWLLFLLVLNLAFWIMDSFFEMKNNLRRTYMISSVYWGGKGWRLISKLLYPILIFFRFHSVAMIAHIWLNFRVKKKLL